MVGTEPASPYRQGGVKIAAGTVKTASRKPPRPHPRALTRPVAAERTRKAGVVALIQRPYVAETLAALHERPHTLAELRRSTGAPRRYAVAALRALAAYRAVGRTPAAGTWDTGAGRRVRYRLTPTGETLIDELFHLDVWRAVYDPAE
jgi:DNA-binding HxlR family transcriptional regulator